MKNRLVFSQIIFVGCVFFAGCLSLDPLQSDNSCPPAWYVTPPQDRNFLYATGKSGPTHKPSYARRQALDRAKEMLLFQIKTYVESEILMLQNLDGAAYMDVETMIEAKGKVKNFTIVAEHYCFKNQDHTSQPGSSFILIRVPKTVLR